jgi:phage repressor protein C with HTH and peptisase S24 domain
MRRSGLALGTAFLFAGGAFIGRRKLTRVAVSGHSMEPTLCDGDWLLVERSPSSIRNGDVVVAADPRSTGRVIVKRVRSVRTDDDLILAGDHPAHSNETIGPLRRADVLGKVVARYWPLARLGRV